MNFKINRFIFIFIVLLAQLKLLGQLNHVWSKGMGSTGTDAGYSITRDSVGDIIVCGQYSGVIDLDPSAATYTLPNAGFGDCFVAKYNSNGQFIWAVGFGGIGGDIAKEVKVDRNNNVYVCGYFSNTIEFNLSSPVYTLQSQGNEDIFLAKYSSTGQLNWASSFGSTAYDQGVCIGIDSLSNCYLTGTFEGTVDFDPSPSNASIVSNGGEDFFIAKYNSLGNYQWAFDIGGANNQDRVYSIAVNSAGDSYITGFFSSTCDFDPSPTVANLTSNSNADLFLAKYNSNGNYQWAFHLGTSTHSGLAFDVALDSDDNAYIVGEFYGNIDFNPATPVATLNLISSNGDVFLAKYDVNGGYMWAFNLGYTPTNTFFRCYCVYTNMFNEVYITGQLSGNPDMNPSASSTYTLPFVGGNMDAFISKYDSEGLFITAISMGSINTDLGYALVEDHSHNLYFTGGYSDVIDMDPSSNTSTLNPINGSLDLFIAKYNTPCNGFPLINVVASSTYICTGQSVTLTVSGANSYTWNTSSNSSSIIISPTISSTYTVIGEAYSCVSNTSSLNINVVSCTGILEYDPNDAIQIFPNPATDLIHIISDQELKFVIVNSIGEIVLKDKLHLGKNKIDISDFPKGFYLLKTTDLNSTFKIIKD